jgi:formiminotetrahydrofolate cyclodeaminase
MMKTNKGKQIEREPKSKWTILMLVNKDYKKAGLVMSAIGMPKNIEKREVA